MVKARADSVASPVKARRFGDLATSQPSRPAEGGKSIKRGATDPVLGVNKLKHQSAMETGGEDCHGVPDLVITEG